jgi:DNA-binding NtrC family response regulator
MTAHHTTETAVEAIQKGACDYLNKPISTRALAIEIQGVLAELLTRR